ncbi:MAG TPA: RNA-binding domain-containing protein [Thermoplasmata archaeon]|nr:RNA-binding domain-containing protein [Thermoplasmata archaeon]
MVRIRVRAGCKPTESLPKVKIAIVNLFPDARFVREHDVVEAESASLDALRDRIRGQKIRDAARGALLAGVDGPRLRFTLNKQAAYVGKVSFATGSPVGDLEVEMEDGDPERIVDAIAESTTRPPPEPLH